MSFGKLIVVGAIAVGGYFYATASGWGTDYNTPAWQKAYDEIVYADRYWDENARTDYDKKRQADLCAKHRNQMKERGYSIVRPSKPGHSIEMGCHYKDNRDNVITTALKNLTKDALTSGEPIELRCLGWSNIMGSTHWDKAGVVLKRDKGLEYVVQVAYERMTGKQWYDEDCDSL